MLIGITLALALQGAPLPELTSERCRAAATQVSSYLALGRSMVASLKAAGKKADGLQKPIDDDQKRIDAIVRHYGADRPSQSALDEAGGYDAETMHRLLEACAQQAG